METLQKNAGKVRVFGWMVALANWLARLPNKLTPPPFRLLQIGSAFWQSRALYVATSLGVADELADGERSCAELADTLSLHEDHLYRLLRMLASIGIFTEQSHRHFVNSPLSDYLRRDHPKSVRAMILMHNSPEMSRPWFESLEQGVRTGEVPFALSHGEELFGYMDHHPEFDALFSQAMASVEALTGTDYLHDFDWARFERIVDVGGSQGAKTMAVLRRHSHLTAVVFDRPPVVSGARQYWEGAGEGEAAGRIEFIGGDMLDSIPVAQGPGDIYLFMAVFHGMGDEDALRVLANLRRALDGSGATVAIVDNVAEECGIDPNVAGFDMQMLIGTRGRERTRREWTHLLHGAGFAINEIVNVRTFAKFIVLCADKRGD